MDVVVLATKLDPVLVELGAEAEFIFGGGCRGFNQLSSINGLVANLMSAMLFLRFDSNIF